jgi:formate dehydrogenase subunit gamma
MLMELPHGIDAGAQMTPQSAANTSVDAKAVCARHGFRPDALLEILHDVQHEAGFVPQAALPVIAEALNLSRADVHGVMSFYHDFKSQKQGRVLVQVCRAEACQSMGAFRMIESFLARRGLKIGETSADGALTVDATYCLGNCALAPAAMINGRLHGRLDAAMLERRVAEASA